MSLLSYFLRSVANELDGDIEEATSRNKKQQNREREQKAAIVSSIERLANSFETYNKKHEAEESGKRNRENKTIFALFAAALFTLVLVGVSACQLIEMQKAYGPLDQSAKSASDQVKEIIADRRPFVSIDEDHIRITKPLTFEDMSASVEFTAPFKNVGKSVALGVSKIVGDLKIGAIFPQETLKDPIALQGYVKNLIKCDEETARQNTQIGWVLLPGAAHEATFQLSAIRTAFKVEKMGHGFAWFPICIVYRDDEDRLHGTAFIVQYQSIDQKELFVTEGLIEGTLEIKSLGVNLF